MQLQFERLYELVGKEGTCIQNIVGSGASCTLPVHFVQCAAQALSDRIVLNWITSNEYNASHFEVERRTNNTDTFVSIGRLNLQTNNNAYSFEDKTAQKNNLYQYRIKQVDVDGKTSYSSTLEARLKGRMSSIKQIAPNPIQNDQLTVELEYNTNEPLIGRIYDLQGRLLVQQSIKTIGNTNKLVLDVNQLAKGTYLLNLVHPTRNLEVGSALFVK